jgi:hypothetical protein
VPEPAPRSRIAATANNTLRIDSSSRALIPSGDFNQYIPIACAVGKAAAPSFDFPGLNGNPVILR